MNISKERGKKKNVNDILISRVKNPELIRKTHLHIAKRASKLFIKRGYSQTTMREIADAAGMTVGNLYNYIEKKEDVLCLVFEVFHQAMNEYLEKKRFWDIEDPKEQLRTLIHSMIENGLNFRDEIVLMYIETRMLPKGFKKKIMQREIEDIEAIENVIIKGVNQGVFSVKNPFYAASMIVYQLSIGALRGWTFKNKLTTEEIIDMTEEFTLKTVIN